MQTYNGQFEQELRKLVDGEIERRLVALANTHANPAYSDYTMNCGILQGLRMVSDLCDQANTIMSER